MKHWNELTELETAIIRVGEFKNLFKLLVAGAENDVDMKVVQSAIYTLEGMIDDIDSTLYEKFETVFDAVRNESFHEENEKAMPQDTFTIDPDYGDHGGGSTLADYPEFNISTMPGQSFDNTMFSNITITGSENQGTTPTSEEDEAFKELEKAIKNWHKQAQ